MNESATDRNYDFSTIENSFHPWAQEIGKKLILLLSPDRLGWLCFVRCYHNVIYYTHTQNDAKRNMIINYNVLIDTATVSFTYNIQPKTIYLLLHCFRYVDYGHGTSNIFHHHQWMGCM